MSDVALPSEVLCFNAPRSVRLRARVMTTGEL